MTLDDFRERLVALVEAATDLPRADVLEALNDECEVVRGDIIRAELREPLDETDETSFSRG